MNVAKRSLLLSVVVAILCMYGCFAQPEAEVTEPVVRPFSSELQDGIDRMASEQTDAALQACFERGLHVYAVSRVVDVTPDGREPSAFGPWTAQSDYLTEDASEDGSLTQWYDNYYITHEWSSTGVQILSLIPGDTVEVNGQLVTIEGIFNYPKDSYYDEIMTLVGSDSVVFQTCYPDSTYNRIAWGH